MSLHMWRCWVGGETGLHCLLVPPSSLSLKYIPYPPSSPASPTSPTSPHLPLQDLFLKYYDTVMPLLLHILTSANAKEHRLMRAKALECISLVGMAVGRDRFRDHARQVGARGGGGSRGWGNKASLGERAQGWIACLICPKQAGSMG